MRDILMSHMLTVLMHLQSKYKIYWVQRCLYDLAALFMCIALMFFKVSSSINYYKMLTYYKLKINYNHTSLMNKIKNVVIKKEAQATAIRQGKIKSHPNRKEGSKTGIICR